MNKQEENNQRITRKEAIQKIGNYSKYAALTALGTYLILNPKKASTKWKFQIQEQGFNLNFKETKRRSN